MGVAMFRGLVCLCVCSECVCTVCTYGRFRLGGSPGQTLAGIRSHGRLVTQELPSFT